MNYTLLVVHLGPGKKGQMDSQWDMRQCVNHMSQSTVKHNGMKCGLNPLLYIMVHCYTLCYIVSGNNDPL